MPEEYEPSPIDPVDAAFSSLAALRVYDRRTRKSRLRPLCELLQEADYVYTMARRRASRGMSRKDANNNMPDVYGKALTKQDFQRVDGAGCVQGPNAA